MLMRAYRATQEFCQFLTAPRSAPRSEFENDLADGKAGEYDLVLTLQSNLRLLPALHPNSNGGPQYAYYERIHPYDGG